MDTTMLGDGSLLGSHEVTATPDWVGGLDPTETTVHLLSTCADDSADQLFLDFAGTQWTYAEVWQRSRMLAAGLRHHGVQPGDTVVSMLDNNVEAITTWFAANLLGAIWVPVNTALKGAFLEHVVRDAGAHVVVCESDLAARFAPLADDLGLNVIIVRGDVDLDADLPVVGLVTLLAEHTPLEEWWQARPGDVSFLIYTGGTTGPSKGCTMTHAYVFNAARSFIVQQGRLPVEHNWSPLPAYHFNLVSGTVLATMLLRSSASVAPKFSVSGFWPDVLRSGARIVNLLGSMGALIAQMPETPEMEKAHGQIRVVHGAPFPPDLQRAWKERFGVEHVGGNTYGLTEAFPITTLPVEVPSPLGSSGQRNEADFDVRIFDADDRELGPGEVGEIVCRPRRPGVMFQGYWRRPEATVAVTSSLWFRTGDLGTFDADGYFFFVDRKKDYLRRRGENVSSQEVEATIASHPQVREVAVHAVLSDLTEDDIKVTAVLHDGAQLQPRELFEWSKDRIPYFALPRYIEFRDALPVSALGRVHKYQLRDEGCTSQTWDREREDVQWDRR